MLPFIPVHSGNVLVGAIYRGFFIRFQNNSYSERFVLTSNESGLLDHSDDLGIENPSGRMSWYYPYFMNNLSFGKKFGWQKIDLWIDFKVNNLFDETYRSVIGRYMPGRNYQVVVRIGVGEKD
jgi:outer membrane receptor protein involved in Fe transport